MGRGWGFLYGFVHRHFRQDVVAGLGEPRPMQHRFQLKGGYAALECVTYSSISAAHREHLRDQNGAVGPLAAYRELCRLGQLKPGDVAQEQVAAALDKLHGDISKRGEPKNSVVQGWFAKLSWKPLPMDNNLQGLYIHGGVGRGKTMLMDLFYDKVSLRKKRRVHFHAFMLDVHGRLHSLLVEQPGKAAVSPIKVVAEQLMNEAFLLCLDEVEVTDIADALILRRLFEVLWRLGLVVVATSNSGPDQLYKDGLNRALFEPFIKQLKKQCAVYNLDGVQSTDYRRSLLRLDRLYLQPVADDTDDLLDEGFLTLTGGVVGSKMQVPVMMGRQFEIFAANGVARAKFSELCGGPYGAADYIAISKAFKALFLNRIPWLGDPAREDEARRFITLIDILYEAKILFICSADMSPDYLFVEVKPSQSDDDEQVSSSVRDPIEMRIVGEGGSSGRSTTLIGAMEWSGTGRTGASLAKLGGSSNFTRASSGRTISRLIEMQSQDYVAKTGPFSGTIKSKVVGSG